MIRVREFRRLKSWPKKYRLANLLRDTLRGSLHDSRVFSFTEDNPLQIPLGLVADSPQY